MTASLYLPHIDGAWIDELCDAASNQNMTLRSNHHFYISGGTQSGKSTLAGVIINKIAAKSQTPAIVIGSDPKDDVTRWLCKFSRKFDGMKELRNWLIFATDQIDKQKARVSMELPLLWRREMVVGCYIPRWVRVFDGIQQLPAITFVVNRQHRAYTGEISLETTINSIAIASGELGSCADYLLQTVNGLMKVGITDQQLLWLSKQVLSRQNQ